MADMFINHGARPVWMSDVLVVTMMMPVFAVVMTVSM